MADRRDYVALEWVKGEISETLKQAQYALEAFVEAPDDSNQLEFSLSYVHQVFRTLQMVEFFGAALLAEEMEQLNKAFVDGTVQPTEANLAVLMQAIIQLPSYLEQLQAGQMDLPIVILPLLNDLRATRGDTLLSETAMFSPDMSAARGLIGEPNYAPLVEPKTLQLIRKLRQMYQLSLLNFLKDGSTDNLTYMIKAVRRMVLLTERAKVGSLWRVVDAFAAALSHGLLTNSPAVIEILRSVDAAFREFIQHPLEIAEQYPSETLLKHLLFYLAKIGRNDIERVSQIQDQYRLDESLPNSHAVEEQRSKLNGPDKATLETVIHSLLEETASLKDALDILVRVEQVNAQPLIDLKPAMQHLSDTMAVVGLGNPRRVMDEQISLIDELPVSEPPSSDLMMDIAGALLYVESTLSVIASDDEQSSEALSGLAGISSVHNAVIREARNSIEEVKDLIVEYIGSHFDAQVLNPTPGMINQTSGGLNMIPLGDVSRILTAASGYIEKRLIREKYQPDWKEMDALADSLVGVDYYLERLTQDDSPLNNKILERAITSLNQIGVRVPSESHLDSELTEAEIPSDIQHEAETILESPLSFNEQTDSAKESSEELDWEDILPESESESESEPEVVSTQAQTTDQASEDDLIDEEILEIFTEEVVEVLETIQEHYPTYKVNESDSDALTEVRRAFHTLKGSGRMVGAHVVGETAWSIENMLNRLIDGTISRTDDLLRVIDEVVELVPELMKAFENRTSPNVSRAESLSEIAHALSKGEQVAWPENETTIQNDQSSKLLDESEPLDEALMDVFRSELSSHIEFIDNYLKDEPIGQRLPDALQRALHTVRGSAHMASMDAIAHLVEPVEHLVRHMQEQTRVATADFVALMETLCQYVHQTADNPNADQLIDMDGFLNRVAMVRSELSAPEPESDDGLMSIFLSESMDVVMDAESLIEQWQKTGEADDVRERLMSDLTVLANSAQMADIHPLAQLGHELTGLYQASADYPFIVGEKFFTLAMDGHESLISMMDRLAAGQSIRVDAMFSERYHQLLDLHGAQYEVFEAPTQDTLSPVSPDHIQGTVIEPVEADKINTSEIDADAVVIERFPIVGDPDLVEIFLDEANDIVDGIQESLEGWLADTRNSIEVESLQRDLHTLKGGARMAEITPLGDLAHELEFVYVGLTQGQYKPSDSLVSLLNQCHDTIAEMLADIESNMTCLPAPHLIETITRFRKNPESTIEVAYIPVVEGSSDTFETPISHLETLDNDIDFNASPASESAVIDNVVPNVTWAERETLDRQSEVDAESETVHTDPDGLKNATDFELPDDVDLDILEIFVDEADELLTELEHAITSWQAEPAVDSHADEMKRVLHTLKGGARLAKLVQLGDDSHELESFVVKAQQNQSDIDGAFFNEILRRQDDLVSSIEQLQGWLANHGTSGAIGPSIVQMMAESEQDETASAVEFEPKLEPAPQPLEPQNPETSANNVVAFQTKEAALQSAHAKQAQTARRAQPQETVKVTASLLEGLVNLAGETSIARARLEQEVSDFGYTLSDMDQTIDRLRDHVRRLDLETEAQISFRQERAEETNYEDFDPLEMDRYSHIQQLSRSLMEATYDLQDLKTTLNDKTRDAETILLQQSRINTELQEGLMRSRMVPFNRLLPRLRRIVRQVATELDKNVNFVVGNDEGEVDRTVLERMISPLEHLLRNAVDHGIESPEQRLQAQKSDTGTITLDLSREGGDIVLRLQDDGQGLDVAAIREKAIERELMSADAELNDNEVMQFILEAGFSTASQITQISGRGVGMDVVNSEVKQLGGFINIDSEFGKGTVFIIRLPFTVSVNRALMVNIGDDLYALPLTSIEGIVRVTPRQLKNYYQPNAPLFEYGDNRYRLAYMGSLLHTNVQPNLEAIDAPVPLILVRGSDDKHSMALHVDRLMGSREIVVKTLGSQFSRVPGVSGATILGDGSVVIILDLSGLIRSDLVIDYQPTKALSDDQSSAKTQTGPSKVMVCDDSVTVRKVTSRLLERNGMAVMLANHGGDAIAQMADEIPDLILLDIEMPHMDGFEVASRVRHDERLKHIPIIMITSRTGSKHKERALSIGVNEYMGKPFQEAPLLENIKRLLEAR